MKDRVLFPEVEVPRWINESAKIFLFFILPFIIIYTYYRIFKLLTSKCVNCKQRPKLSWKRWIWELWKVSAMPWKKVVVFCERCQGKVEHRGWVFAKVNNEQK